jgi:hypothetical protein
MLYSMNTAYLLYTWILFMYTVTVCKREGGGMGIWALPRQINTWRKVPLKVKFFRWRHFALPSMSLNSYSIFQRLRRIFSEFDELRWSLLLKNIRVVELSLINKKIIQTRRIQFISLYLSITGTLQFVWIRAFPLLVEEMGNQFKPTIKKLSLFELFHVLFRILYYPCRKQQQNYHKKLSLFLIA